MLGRIVTYPPDCSPTTSSHDTKYLLVLYGYDSNDILAEPMCSRTGPEHLAAYQQATQALVARGLHPNIKRLYNEVFSKLKAHIVASDINYQLAHPHIHQRIWDDQEIFTFKNHLLALISSCDRKLIMNLWERLLYQALLTLNLLRPSRLNPSLSAHMQMQRPFEFNLTPLALPDTRVKIHKKPLDRASWSAYSVSGW